MSQPTVFIATPMYGGQCAGWYTQSILEMVNVFSQNNVKAQFSFMFNESLITSARNALAHQFLKTDATHLMFIDSDIRFRPQDILKMLEVDKEIICGIYPKKEINWTTVKQAMDKDVAQDQLKHYTGSFVVNLVNYAGEVTVPVNEPVEIFNGGTGFMLIKREVFEKLGEKVPSYTNDVGDLIRSNGRCREDSRSILRLRLNLKRIVCFLRTITFVGNGAWLAVRSGQHRGHT
jgi:hypothetical protein